MVGLLALKFPNITAAKVAVVQPTHSKLEISWKREEFLVKVHSCLNEDILLYFKMAASL